MWYCSSGYYIGNRPHSHSHHGDGGGRYAVYGGGGDSAVHGARAGGGGGGGDFAVRGAGGGRNGGGGDGDGGGRNGGGGDGDGGGSSGGGNFAVRGGREGGDRTDGSGRGEFVRGAIHGAVCGAGGVLKHARLITLILALAGFLTGMYINIHILYIAYICFIGFVFVQVFTFQN